MSPKCLNTREKKKAIYSILFTDIYIYIHILYTVILVECYAMSMQGCYTETLGSVWLQEPHASDASDASDPVGAHARLCSPLAAHSLQTKKLRSEGKKGSNETG